MDLERIGAFLGIAAFLGLAILILLVIQQARDLRRLRKWAGMAPERAIEAAETKGEEIPEPEHGRLAGPFIKLGAGIHDQTARMWSGLRRGYRAADRRSPVDLRFILGFLAIAAIAGIVVLTSGFGLYGEDEGKQRQGKSAPPPEKIEVAVLNGTAASGEGAVPGFAQQIAQKVKQAGYKIGEVGDTDTSFVATVVMYEPGMKAVRPRTRRRPRRHPRPDLDPGDHPRGARPRGQGRPRPRARAGRRADPGRRSRARRPQRPKRRLPRRRPPRLRARRHRRAEHRGRWSSSRSPRRSASSPGSRRSSGSPWWCRYTSHSTATSASCAAGCCSPRTQPSPSARRRRRRVSPRRSRRRRRGPHPIGMRSPPARSRPGHPPRRRPRPWRSHHRSPASAAPSEAPPPVHPGSRMRRRPGG